MKDRARQKQTADEHLDKVRHEAREESPEAEKDRPGDRARHLTPGVGWTRGKDIEDSGSQKKAPRNARTRLDRVGEKKYERAAKDFTRRDKKLGRG